jgi:CheY-like chemotaxis protein/anti-sigma regulatory factor (Ser/Thr protein kinase)
VEENDLIDFLKLSAANFESIAVQKGIAFECVFTKPRLKVFFDGEKLQKVINNLLSNAFKFTPSGGTVTLEVVDDAHSISISVSDSGPGLSQEEQKRIFERFYQGGGSNSFAPGTGIGLTLTKELMALHRGTLQVKSQKGKGTTFIANLPRGERAYRKTEFRSMVGVEHSHTLPASISNDDEEDLILGDSPIALIVEDNLDLRNHLRRLLVDEYRVETAENGREGIRRALKIIPDIIVSDLMMPEADGMELVKTLKSDERTSHIPIVLLTAKADLPAKLEGLEHGADDYLVKPFDNSELKIRLKNLIDQRESLRSRYANELILQPSKISLSNPDEIFLKKSWTWWISIYPTPNLLWKYFKRK